MLDRFAGRGQPVGSQRVGAPGSKERFDTGGEIIGMYRDPTSGRAAPTTRGIIHDFRSRRAYRSGAAQRMEQPMMAQAERSVVLERLHASAQRALRGQTPSRLLAYSVDVDPTLPVLHLKAHFSSAPTDDEVEMLRGVETEILADFEEEFEAQTEVEVVPAHTTPVLLRGGVAFRRHRI